MTKSLILPSGFLLVWGNIFLEKNTILFFWYESFYTFAQEKERKKEDLFDPHYPTYAVTSISIQFSVTEAIHALSALEFLPMASLNAQNFYSEIFS